MPYHLIRPLLFSLDAETAHRLSLRLLNLFGDWLPAPAPVDPAPQPVEVMGLRFPNRVGLAAGLDKNGEVIDALARWGFGFLEIGTVTPRPQPGNPRPRMFRLTQKEAIINRMGFNNDGVEKLLANCRAARYDGILGINIGKNFDTPIEAATGDYLLAMEAVYPRASYITVNISSPNTENLRTLQSDEALETLLSALILRREELAERHGKRVPLALKIAPDLKPLQVQGIADAVRRHRIDALIATNTTISREGVVGEAGAEQQGGLSGTPLFELSTDIVRQFATLLGGEVPIIAAGGIMRGEDARAKLEAGASLVQIYSGLVFRGPNLVRDCVAATAQWQPPLVDEDVHLSGAPIPEEDALAAGAPDALPEGDAPQTPIEAAAPAAAESISDLPETTPPTP